MNKQQEEDKCDWLVLHSDSSFLFLLALKGLGICKTTHPYTSYNELTTNSPSTVCYLCRFAYSWAGGCMVGCGTQFAHKTKSCRGAVCSGPLQGQHRGSSLQGAPAWAWAVEWSAHNLRPRLLEPNNHWPCCTWPFINNVALLPCYCNILWENLKMWQAFVGEAEEQALLSRGYALAGSGFRSAGTSPPQSSSSSSCDGTVKCVGDSSSVGWAVKEGTEDLLALVSFVKSMGCTPTFTVIAGLSMGSVIALSSIEKVSPSTESHPFGSKHTITLKERLQTPLYVYLRLWMWI